jgi:transposase
MSASTDRRSVFIAAWQSHGNVRRAMREAGVGSPTTAYRWIDAYKQGGHDDWQGDASESPPRVATEVADQIVALRQRHPTWGKSRIASKLADQHGEPVVSPTGVRSVLRHAGLWVPPKLHLVPGATSDTSHLDHELLLLETQRGIQLDLFNRPGDAITHLHDAVWAPLLRDPAAIPPLLQNPVLGSWLLRGALQLAHALIETGRWGSARWYLELVDDWLRRDEARPSLRQAEYQTAGDQWITEHGTAWQNDGAQHDTAGWVSLRQDDIWLETQQYLGIVLRDGVGEAAVEALIAARETLRGETARSISPHRSEHYLGVIEHDLARLRLRRGYPARAVLRDMRRAEALLEERGNETMLASAAITRAKALTLIHQERGRTVPAVDRVTTAVQSAFELAASSPVVSTRVRVAIEGTELLASRGDIGDEDRDRVADAARLAIDLGLAVQARKLLDNQQLIEMVGDFEPELRRLAG